MPDIFKILFIYVYFFMVGPSWLSLLNIAVHTCQSQTPNLSVPLPSNHKFIVKVCESVSV